MKINVNKETLDLINTSDEKSNNEVLHKHEHEENECSCGNDHKHEHEESECSCGHDHKHEHEESECSCGHDHKHEHEESECSCGNDHKHENEESECSCLNDHKHEHEENECSCGHDHKHEHEESECSCGHEHENMIHGNIKKTWMVSNLDCANCALKVENEIKKLPFVKSVILRFDLGKLIVEFDDEKYISDIEKCAKYKEPDIVLTLLEDKKNKKEYRVTNIDCMACGLKVEDELNKLVGIDATYRFDLQKMIIKSNHEIDDDVIIKTILSKESDAKVSLLTKSKKAEVKAKKDYTGYILIASVIAFISCLVALEEQPIKVLILAIIYIIVGKDVLLKAIRNILKGDVFDENFLMAIATMGAIVLGDYDEAVAVMLFYQVGEYFQSLAVNNSRKSIQSLMEIRPDVANVLVDGKIINKSCEDIGLNEIVVVNPGERIPLDGMIIEGNSSVDFAALTGESLPKNVDVDDMVMSGGVNLSRIIKIKVTTLFEESTASKILALVEDAGNSKADTEKFITKFAKVYTPVVCLLAALLAFIPPLFVGNFTAWFHQGLVFLVISCPCALVISIPLSYFGGIGAASKKGILVKGSQYLEEIIHVNTIACDKTGTLTKGNFEVSEIVAVNKDTEALIEIAALLESASSHPIGKAIIKANKRALDINKIHDLEEIAGNGISAKINDICYLVGNARLMRQYNVAHENIDTIGSTIYIAKENVYIGHIVVSDSLKENTISTVKNIQSKHHLSMAMFSGDNKKVVEVLAKQIGIDKAYGELLPQDKLNFIKKMQSDGQKVAFVGDGMNDAPVLTLANVGIAMGGIGSDAAIEASDIVLMDDEISKLETLIDIAKFTKRIVTQNLVFVLVVKVVILCLGAVGLASMWAAVIADVGVSIVAILNAMRILKRKY